MKLLARILFVVVCCAGMGGREALATPINLGNCWSMVDSNHYLISGDRQASTPGARLWSVDRVRRDLGAADPDGCRDKIMTQALEDANQYWNYIGTKYRCQEPEGRAANPNPCSLYDQNAKFIGTIKSLVHFVQTPLDPCDPTGAATRVADPAPAITQLARNVTAVLPAPQVPAAKPPLKEACADVPPEQRAKPGDTSPSVFTDLGHCGWGIIQGAWREIQRFLTMLNPFKLGPAMWSFLRMAFTDPITLVKNIVKSAYDWLTEDFADWSCYKTEYKFEQACKFGGKLVGSYATAWLGGRMLQLAAGSVRALVATSKSLLAGLKTTARSAEVIEFAPKALSPPGGSTRLIEAGAAQPAGGSRLIEAAPAQPELGLTKVPKPSALDLVKDSNGAWVLKPKPGLMRNLTTGAGKLGKGVLKGAALDETGRAVEQDDEDRHTDEPLRPEDAQELNKIGNGPVDLGGSDGPGASETK